MATVLVVDDNSENRALARETLDDEGYRVVEAKTGEEGVAAALNYTINGRPDRYTSEDPQKLSQRLVIVVQTLVRAEIQSRSRPVPIS